MLDKSTGLQNSIVRSLIIAGIVAAPSLGVFAALFYALDRPIVAGITGGVVHFVALGFAFKIYRKLFGSARS